MPTLGAAAAVLDAGRVLLMKREDVECWALPGGAVEAGETVAEAAVREVREETGIDIRLTRMVGLYSRPRWHRGGDHLILFAAEPVGGRLRPQAGEAVDTAWFPVGALPQPLIWWTRRRVADAVAGRTGVVCMQDAVWPFESDVTVDWMRDDLAASGLTPAQYCERHFGAVGGRGESDEVPPCGNRL